MTLGNHSSYDPRWPQSGHYKPIRWEHSTDKAWGPTHSLLGLWLALTNHGPVLFPHPYIVQPRVTQRKGKAVVCGYYCHALCFPLLLLSLLLFWSWAFFKCLLWQFHTCAQIIHPLQILQNLLLPQLHDLFLTHGVCPVLPMCAWVGGHHLNMNLTVFTYHTRRKKKNQHSLLQQPSTANNSLAGILTGLIWWRSWADSQKTLFHKRSPHSDSVSSLPHQCRFLSLKWRSVISLSHQGWALLTHSCEHFWCVRYWLKHSPQAILF